MEGKEPPRWRPTWTISPCSTTLRRIRVSSEMQGEIDLVIHNSVLRWLRFLFVIAAGTEIYVATWIRGLT